MDCDPLPVISAVEHTFALLTRNVLAIDSMFLASRVKHMNVDPRPPLRLRHHDNQSIAAG
jgi:hypothetical protein